MSTYDSFMNDMQNHLKTVVTMFSVENFTKIISIPKNFMVIITN